MGTDIELLEEMKAAIEQLKSILNNLKIEYNGSINANIQGDVNVGAVSIEDYYSHRPANVNNDGRLLVSQEQNAGITIVDANNPALKASVDTSGRLLVSTPPPTPPADTTPVIITAFGPVSGNAESPYIITNGKTLVIGRLLAGSEEATKACRVTLYENSNGDGVTLNLIATLYTNGNSDKFDLSQKFQGDGIRKIILRRTNLGGGSKEVFARFEGYEE